MIQDKDVSTMRTFEYKEQRVTKDNRLETLNAMGAQGWRAYHECSGGSGHYDITFERATIPVGRLPISLQTGVPGP